MPSLRRAWLPSPVLLHGLVVVVLLGAISVTKGLVDPDYYWHVTAGQLIATSGVPSTDPFSFAWAGRPWTPHEWLSELLMYQSLVAFGPGSTLLVFGVIAGAAVGLVGWGISRLGVRTVAVVLPATLATVVFIPYVTARPQAVSWLMLAAELVLLMLLRPARAWLTLLLVPFFAVWANLHGLYVIGLGVLAVYALFTLVGRTPMAAARPWIVGTALAALLASTATPAGPAGLLYPLRYVDSSDWGLANIAEWQSPDFHEPAHLAFLALILAVAANGGRATPGWLATLAYVGVAMGLLALRNAPLSALLSMPTLALGLDVLLPRRARPPMRPSVATGRRVIEAVAAIAVAVAAWIILVPAEPDRAAVQAAHEEFPVEAVSRLAANDPDARVVAEYGWAGYVINQLYRTGGRVFVDGRNDMYPEQLLEDYSAVRSADPGWEDILDRERADWLLFPPQTTITRGPATDAGWCEAYRDERQVLLGRCP